MRSLPIPFYDTIWGTSTLGFNDVRPGMDIGSDGVSTVWSFVSIYPSQGGGQHFCRRCEVTTSEGGKWFLVIL
jgi:hypothetical protein